MSRKNLFELLTTIGSVVSIFVVMIVSFNHSLMAETQAIGWVEHFIRRCHGVLDPGLNLGRSIPLRAWTCYNYETIAETGKPAHHSNIPGFVFFIKIKR